MSEPLFKVRVRYPFDPNDRGRNWDNAVELVDRASVWLFENNRMNHHVNVYDNDAEGLTFVVDNRTTAILLKLALA